MVFSFSSFFLFGNNNLLPNKIKMFVWKMFQNILPTNENLYRRSIPVLPWCAMCGKDRETMDHSILRCKRAKKIWETLLPQMRSISGTNLSLQVFCPLAAQNLSSDELEIFCVGAWALWEDRNLINRGMKICSLDLKIEYVLSYIREIKEHTLTHGRGLAESDIPRGAPSSEMRWRPPEQGSFKLNVDAACGPLSNSTGLGMVIRDNAGRMVEAEAIFLPEGIDVLAAEALALLSGMKSVVEYPSWSISSFSKKGFWSRMMPNIHIY